MIKIKSLFSIVFLSFASFGTLSIPEQLKESSERIVTEIINCEFTRAINICDSLKITCPQDPMPSLLKLAAMGMRDIDCEQIFDSVGFLKEYQITDSLIRVYSRQNGISSYILTLDGFSKAMHAAFYLRQKAYFSVLQNGVDAIRLMREAKEMDSSNTDVDFFLGLYDYGKSELKKKLWWVLFWYPGSKKDGIKKLIECSKGGILTGKAAMLSLSDIYLQEKKPQNSAALIENLEKQFENSRFVLWSKVKYFEYLKNYDSAAVVYEKLSVFYALIPEGKKNFFSTRNKMAHMLKLSGKNDIAAQICRSILEDKQVNDFRDIKKDTSKLLENLDNGRS